MNVNPWNQSGEVRPNMTTLNQNGKGGGNNPSDQSGESGKDKSTNQSGEKKEEPAKEKVEKGGDP